MMAVDLVPRLLSLLPDPYTALQSDEATHAACTMETPAAHPLRRIQVTAITPLYLPACVTCILTIDAPLAT